MYFINPFRGLRPTKENASSVTIAANAAASDATFSAFSAAFAATFDAALAALEAVLAVVSSDS